MTTIDDLALLKDAAVAAGAIARRAYEQGAKHWSKPGGSPVTEADIAVDRFLQRRLRAARPAYGWLSEETPDDTARLSAARLFIVDPIDGTRAFVKHRPNWTISLAVIEGEAPIAGVVIAPMLDEIFEASAGGGARLNGAPIRASARTELAGAAITGPKEAMPAPPWPEVERDTFNSLAYRVCLVASGARDATISISTFHEWDIAAADLIVREAGGTLTELGGEPTRYNKAEPHCQGLVAAGPALHPQILAIAGRRTT